MKVALTFDIEEDCPPHLSSTLGIKTGLPKILSLLEKFDIKSTLFVAGHIAEKFPDLVKEISKEHEIGSHGYVHEAFNEITQQKKKALKKSKEVLENIIGGEVVGFRAPYLKVCNELYPVLEELGFKYDSSIGSFMRSHRDIRLNNLREFKLEIPNVIIRFPAGLIKFKRFCKKSPFPILFFHPWEAIDMRALLPKSIMNYYMRPDNWYNTGNIFMKKLKALIEYLLDEKFQFVILKDLI